MRGVDHIVERAIVPLGLHGVALGVERAVLGRGVDLIARLRILREYRDDAAGGIAVQRRERAAQHLDVIRGAQIELRELALAVRHRARNPVRIQPHAAHSEARARAEAADRQLQILRVVLTALHGYSRHGDQRLRQIHLQLAVVNGLPLDPIDRHRQIEARFGDSGGGDHDGGEFRRRFTPGVRAEGDQIQQRTQ